MSGVFHFGLFVNCPIFSSHPVDVLLLPEKQKAEGSAGGRPGLHGAGAEHRQQGCRGGRGVGRGLRHRTPAQTCPPGTRRGPHDSHVSARLPTHPAQRQGGTHPLLHPLHPTPAPRPRGRTQGEP